MERFRDRVFTRVEVFGDPRADPRRQLQLLLPALVVEGHPACLDAEAQAADERHDPRLLEEQPAVDLRALDLVLGQQIGALREVEQDRVGLRQPAGEDLYYRLHVFEISLPRLRDRPDDIPPLSEAFLEDIGRSFGRPPAGISKQARELLMTYHWPGNVRQLRNTLERAAILCEGGLITGEHLSLPARAPGASAPAPKITHTGGDHDADSATGDLKSMERSAIEKALLEAKHNKSKAARLLGLTRTQLYVRLRESRAGVRWHGLAETVFADSED